MEVIPNNPQGHSFLTRHLLMAFLSCGLDRMRPLGSCIFRRVQTSGAKMGRVGSGMRSGWSTMTRQGVQRSGPINGVKLIQIHLWKLVMPMFGMKGKLTSHCLLVNSRLLYTMTNCRFHKIVRVLETHPKALPCIMEI